MLSDKLSQAIKGDALKQRVLWMASISSIGLYCAVALIVAQRGGDGMDLPGVIGWALIAAGYAVLAGAFFVRRLLLPAARINALLDEPVDVEELARNSNTGQVQQDRLALLQQLSEDEVRLCALARAALKPYLLTLALVDVCAIMGLVLAILQRDFNAILPFAIAAGAVSVVHFPNLEGFLEEARTRRRQRV